MKKGILALLISSSMICFGQDQRPIGANLTDLSPFSTLWTYTNALKQSSGWLITNANDHQDPIKQSTELRYELSNEFDAYGYPLRIPFSNDHPDTQGKNLVVSCLVLNGQPAPYYYPAGNYLLVYEGTGSITIQGDVDGGALSFSTPGTHEVPISNPTNLGLELFITLSDADDPVRNVQLIFPEFVNNYQTQKYNTGFVDIVSHFKVLRFMKPLRVEHNIVENWQDRPNTADFSHYMDIEDRILLGIPYEDIIEFCNQFEIDPWICVPHRANDEYVEELARLFDRDLDDQRTLYLEYTNEGWNPSYPEKRQYMLDQGIALGLATSTHPELVELEAVHRFHALRSFQIFEIFNSVFADDSRIVKVHGTQSDPFIADLIFDSYEMDIVNPNNMRPDAVAVASYVGVTLFDEFAEHGLEVCDHSAQDLLDTLRARTEKEIIELNERWAQLSNQNNIDLYAYEGGQHVTEINFQPMDPCAEALVAEMNRLAEMEDFFCDLFDVWYETLDGELFMVFNLAERPDPFGAFGVLESQWQPLTESAKWKGLSACAIDYSNEEVGIESINLNVIIYPNPITDHVNILLSEFLNQTVEIRVNDLTGKSVFIDNLYVNHSNYQISALSIESGTYILNIGSEYKSAHTKLIVK